MRDTVSVIIPTFNRANLTMRAINSVLTQTYNDLSVIVIDDGSTDNTEHVVTKVEDHRVSYFKTPFNAGPSGARNHGIELSTGKYIAFLDSDDEWLPSKLEKQISVMNNLTDDWGICHTGAIYFKDNFHAKLFKPDLQLSGHVYKQFVLNKISFVTSSLLFRRSCINHIGFFDPRLWQAEDADLLFRALKEYKLAIVQEPLVVMHLSTTKVMDTKKVEFAQQLLITKYSKDIRELGLYTLKHFRSSRLWIIADNKFRSGLIIQGTYYFFKAFCENPLAIPCRGIISFFAAIRLLNFAKNIQRWVHEVFIKRTI